MKKLYLLILSIFVLMSFSCAFASDANETIINHDVNVDGSVPIMIDGNNSVDNTNRDVNVDGTVPTGNGDNSAGNTNISYYDYYDLQYEIQRLHSGDTFNITRDYKLNDVRKDFDGNVIDRVIIIKQDNIIINGNGHIIDVGGIRNSAMFNVLGNNVTISNLTLIGSNIVIPNLDITTLLSSSFKTFGA